IWNGPLGKIEEKPFMLGTLKIAQAIVNNKKTLSIVGGGETITFLKKQKLDKKIKFISTGGGAMLEFLAGKKLPGIEALKNKN
ncbi:MAG: phosphoglycerate kinase, partial [Leptonema sp. (in: bacteria)]